VLRCLEENCGRVIGNANCSCTWGVSLASRIGRRMAERPSRRPSPHTGGLVDQRTAAVAGRGRRGESQPPPLPALLLRRVGGVDAVTNHDALPERITDGKHRVIDRRCGSELEWLHVLGLGARREHDEVLSIAHRATPAARSGCPCRAQAHVRPTRSGSLRSRRRCRRSGTCPCAPDRARAPWVRTIVGDDRALVGLALHDFEGGRANALLRAVVERCGSGEISGSAGHKAQQHERKPQQRPSLHG